MTPDFSKLRVLLLAAVLVAGSVWLYTTPPGQSVRSSVAKALPDAAAGPLTAVAPPPAAPTPEPTVVSPPEAGRSGALEARTIVVTAPATDDGPRTWRPPPATPHPRPTPSPRPAPSPDPAPTPAPTPGPKKIEGCWSFTWQQDAQAFYVVHPDDALGLDGAKGPRNGDGIACAHLPVDSQRPASTPYWPFEAVLPTKADLLAPEGRFFGVAEDGIPGDSRLMDKLSSQVGKSPSMVEWFSTWDEPFTAGKVDQAWARGALPVITWMPGHKGNKVPEDTSQDNVLAGKWDDYIRTYAQAVVAQGKPVVLRFAHEQNGNWYPWSAGGNRAFYNGSRGEPYQNTPKKFIAMWRHVWQIFQDEGANADVIWAWTPVKADGIKANTTDISQTSFGLSDMEDSYPGDPYVDWVGMSGYAYQTGSWSYTKTFKKTFDRLKSMAPGKRILVAETGASENSGSVSNTAKKAAWISQTMAGFGTDSHLVGFVWFNNTVVDVHTINGVRVTTDNKWDTSQQSLQAFTEAMAKPVWMTGTAPDTTVTSSTTAKTTVAITP